MRRLAVFLSVLIMLLAASGCEENAEENVSYSLDTAAQVGPGEWGVPFTGFAGQLSGGTVTTEGDGSGISHVLVSGADFYGHTVTIDYGFYPAEGAEAAILSSIRITAEDDTDLRELSEAITGVLGPQETQGYTADGETYDLGEDQRYWHTEETVLETGGEAFRQQLLDDGYGAGNDFGLTAEAYADFMLAHSYPATVSFEDTESGAALAIDGNYAAALRQWAQQEQS